jgi:hypothetical protein
MGIKATLAGWAAKYVHRQTQRWIDKPIESQKSVFKNLMTVLSTTQFGQDHGVFPGMTHEEYASKVPVRDYEALRSYFDRIANGEENVCWKGKPIYLAKTSGTTSGAKYIPITQDSIGNHINSARNALLNYIYQTGNASFVEGKLIFLSGSPVLDKKGGIFTGRLSGISNHHIPAYLRSSQLPSWETNCIEDWEIKVQKIADETIQEDMRLISGIPPWVQMYFDILHERTEGKRMADIFPNLSLFVYGGVNFEPYRKKLTDSIGKQIDALEFFPASEGFFAYQDKFPSEGLLLLLNEGIFYEFIPADEYFNEKPSRLNIEQVQIGVNYALIINSNAGLWGYSIGDTVRFVSLNPYRVVVSGRIKHFISAFGEHVIGEEVEYALLSVAKEHGIGVTEFTVAPQVNPPSGGLPFHEWFIEFSNPPADLTSFSMEVDKALQKKNIYYFDLIEGNVLRPLVITPLNQGAFIEYMKSQGKLGGQNKVPRLSNDRKIADEIGHFTNQL